MLLRSRRVGIVGRLRRAGFISTWLRRHPQFVRRAGWTVLSAAGMVVAIQLAYPAGRSLPFVTIQDISIGNMTNADIAKQLTGSYAKATVTFKTDTKTIGSSLAEVGADIDALASARAASNYPLAQRLIPFSSVYIMSTRNTKAVMQYDDERLATYAQHIEKDAFEEAINATITIKDGAVSLVSAVPEKTYPAADIRKLVRQTGFSPKTTLRMQPHTKPAVRSNEEVQTTLKTAQKAVDTDLTLEIKGVTTKIDAATIGSWLYFPEDVTSKKLTMAVKPEALNAYFEKEHAQTFKAAGVTKIQVIDGREVGRTVGAKGQGVDTVKMTVAIEQALRSGKKTTLPVSLSTIDPKVAYERTYSNSDSGLKTLLETIGGGYGIAVMELNGRSGTINGSKQFVSASTYKLYIAYAVAKEVEAGRMKWDDAFNGQTVASCFDKMIVVSDNACPKAFGSKFGWQAVEDMMHSIGLSAATQMSPSNYTTANDLALFLYKLQNGTLLSSDSTSRLLDAMKRQSYTRAGIPAGAQGSSVADKVGDVDGYKHDAAIVYGPKGPYVLIVMTSGGSWASIASVTSQLHTYLNK